MIQTQDKEVLRIRRNVAFRKKVRLAFTERWVEEKQKADQAAQDGVPGINLTVNGLLNDLLEFALEAKKKNNSQTAA